MINVGQIRESSIQKYLNDVPVEQPSTRDVPGKEGYKDTVINCTTLDSSKSYYFLVKIVKGYGELSQMINIRLRHREEGVSANTEDSYQNLKTVTVSELSEEISIEVIFTPNAGYNQISFDLVRVDIDQTDPTRRVQIKESSLYEIENIVDKLKPLYPNPPLNTLKQIGVRSEPGLRMCINGEEIFVGPTGVYEVYNGVKIKYLGFIIDNSAITSNKKINFILDFTYEGEERYE